MILSSWSTIGSWYISKYTRGQYLGRRKKEDFWVLSGGEGDTGETRGCRWGSWSISGLNLTFTIFTHSLRFVMNVFITGGTKQGRGFIHVRYTGRWMILIMVNKFLDCMNLLHQEVTVEAKFRHFGFHRFTGLTYFFLFPLRAVLSTTLHPLNIDYNFQL